MLIGKGASSAVDDATCLQVSLYRTHVLGGRKFQCADCDEITSLYNSYGDRHCRQCSGGKRVDFNEKATPPKWLNFKPLSTALPGILAERSNSDPPKLRSGG